MPRPRMPPTPSSSTDLVGKDRRLTSEMESVFALPPPAIVSTGSKTTSKIPAKSLQTGDTSPPASPNRKQATQRKRTLSGSTKARAEPQSHSPSMQTTDGILPPPPSRARKIIQMKPKQASSAAIDQTTPTSTRPSSSHKEASTTSSASKRKAAQPSTTSAAGRKIARKTAHSIIERRRRSKMNEEFGVLKDMIPACTGVEMHKLAILQAGIEYVRYLEGCIDQLQSRNEKPQSTRSTPHVGEVDEELDDSESMDVDREVRREPSHFTNSSAAVSESETSSPSLRMKSHTGQLDPPLPAFRKASIATTGTNSTYASPDLRPVQSSASLTSHSAYQGAHPQLRHAMSAIPSNYSASPPPVSAPTPSQTGVSPAFGAFHFSPDLSRTTTWSSINGNPAQHKPSPNILPLPQAAMPLQLSSSLAAYANSNSHTSQHLVEAGEGQAEATATAALLMMTKDRRDNTGMPRSSSSKGMSVKDLLSS